jgi:hypothetical protein
MTMTMTEAYEMMAMARELGADVSTAGQGDGRGGYVDGTVEVLIRVRDARTGNAGIARLSARTDAAGVAAAVREATAEVRQAARRTRRHLAAERGE